MVEPTTKKKARIPRSHQGLLMVSVTGKRGLHVYFKKKASGRNLCIANKLRKQGGGKGSGRAKIRGLFKTAVTQCPAGSTG